jgi:hypothetical protein
VVWHVYAVMLDRARNAWKLLSLLTAFSGGFLVCICLFKPFRDSEGHKGWTVGDKAQVSAQLGILSEYAMAALCLWFGSDMPTAVELLVIAVSLGAVVCPLCHMRQLSNAAGDAITPVGTEDPTDDS